VKALMPFGAVCLGLLAVAGWQVKLVTRQAPSNYEQARGKTSATAAPADGNEDVQLAQEPKRTAAARAREPKEHSASQPSGPARTPPSSQASVSPAAPATQATVRWAGDEERAAKKRFAELRQILVADPYNQAALEAALELARRLEWHNEACDLLGRLVRLRRDDVGLRFELATQLMRLERWLEAIPQLRFVVEAQPENERAWYDLAIAHQALGHLRDARATWNRVIQLMPANPDAYAHRGEVLLDLRAWTQAAADFETSLGLSPGALDATMNLALALAKLGRADQARDRLLPLLERHPVHVPLLNRLAELTWTLYQSDPAENHALAEETVGYCARSLAINDAQPEIKALHDRAAQVGN
jgi:predicted Zn-dependent protease